MHSESFHTVALTGKNRESLVYHKPGTLLVTYTYIPLLSVHVANWNHCLGWVMCMLHCKQCSGVSLLDNPAVMVFLHLDITWNYRTSKQRLKPAWAGIGCINMKVNCVLWVNFQGKPYLSIFCLCIIMHIYGLKSHALWEMTFTVNSHFHNASLINKNRELVIPTPLTINSSSWTSQKEAPTKNDALENS